MVEILYKGQDEKGNWHYSMSLAPHITENGIITHYYIGTGYISVLAETVSSFTGVTDINSKKIFGGDICKCEDTEYVIVWSEEMCGWYCKVLKAKTCLLKDVLFPLWHWNKCVENGYKQLEIIGNIHDKTKFPNGGAK